MKKTHNISLFIYDEAKIKENAGRYFFVKFLCLTFTFQIGIIFVFFVNLWGWRESLKNRVAVGYGRNWLSHFIYFN